MRAATAARRPATATAALGKTKGKLVHLSRPSRTPYCSHARCVNYIVTWVDWQLQATCAHLQPSPPKNGESVGPFDTAKGVMRLWGGQEVCIMQKCRQWRTSCPSEDTLCYGGCCFLLRIFQLLLLELAAQTLTQATILPKAMVHIARIYLKGVYLAVVHLAKRV